MVIRPFRAWLHKALKGRFYYNPMCNVGQQSKQAQP